jgi:hypothetical protein
VSAFTLPKQMPGFAFLDDRQDPTNKRPSHLPA